MNGLEKICLDFLVLLWRSREGKVGARAPQAMWAHQHTFCNHLKNAF